MKKSLFFIVFLITVVLTGGSSAHLGFASDEGLKAKVISKLKKAKTLTGAGEFLKAQVIYEKLLEMPGLNEKQKKAIFEKYEGLNYQMLFSHTETPASIFHTVAAGDSLYEIAKKNHTTVELIKKMNDLHKDTILPGKKLKIATGEFSIRVDKSANVLELFYEGKPVKHYRVATGVNNGTPTGKFKITDKLTNPTWYKVGAVVPPESPDNSLGVRWLGFDLPGYGIHGTTEPESIGKQASAGCVRMLNDEVEDLYDFVPSGTKVTIVD